MVVCLALGCGDDTADPDAGAEDADAFTAPYEGFVAVGPTVTEGWITATGGCECPIQPPPMGECRLRTDSTTACDALCPQCVDRITVRAPGEAALTWEWTGLGGVLGMTFSVLYEEGAGDTVSIDIEGCHGPRTYDRDIVARAEVVVATPEAGANSTTVRWQATDPADAAFVKVLTEGYYWECIVADTGELTVETTADAPVTSVFVQRRWQVGRETSPTEDITYYEAADGRWTAP